ncbi:MAG: hypothetical protein Q7T73_13115 [Beijerinckiaceae bacterium]|nr:hypothetical protein [Beijerinckiaceae bacterium]
MRERIHAAPDLPFDTVVVVEDGRIAVVGRLSELRFEEGDEAENVDIYMHPEEVEFFIAKWFPGQAFAKRLVN